MSTTQTNKAAEWITDYNHLAEWVAAEGSDAVAEIVTQDALEDAGLELDFFEVRDAIELSLNAW